MEIHALQMQFFILCGRHEIIEPSNALFFIRGTILRPILTLLVFIEKTHENEAPQKHTLKLAE